MIRNLANHEIVALVMKLRGVLDQKKTLQQYFQALEKDFI